MPSPISKIERAAREEALNSRAALWRAMREFPFRNPEFRRRALAARASFVLLLGASAVLGVMVGLLLVYSVTVPQMADLERYRPSTTTQLYDIHGRVFGSFALERRVVVSYDDIPPVLREAILSIEDKNFERNGGVNLVRVVGAAWRDLHAHGKSQGASTLTMQLARNLFLSSEKTYGRKLQEIFLTLQIERHFTKTQIFALYANQIYLGRGSYGFEAGSEYYFSKHVRDLTLAEAATLAAMPKGPEYYSPVRFPERAIKRRNLVLSEMLADHKITAEQAAEAKAEPLVLHLETPANSEAPYFVEEVRRQLERDYGVDAVHGSGLRIYTSLDLDLERAATKAVMDGTAAYERRHGWKGKLENVIAEGADPGAYKHPDWTDPVVDGAYFHALVVSVAPTKMTVRIGAVQTTLTPADWVWTQKLKATDLVQPGDLVYVKVESGAASGAPHVLLQQDSGAQAAIMAVDNANGEVLAMVGGRNFALSQFNRATQAQRQVGSSFKPYVYTAAVEEGAKPFDHVLDEPTTFSTPGGPYTPHNYEPNYRGSMTLIDAFAESRNIPALRLADKVGIKKVIEVAHRFGITSNIPAFLPVAIGSADITLAEQVGAYSVFPNDGIRIAPHYIRRIEQANGEPVQQRTPEVREVISLEVARTMMQLLRAVTEHGTAAATASMKHAFGGKTGTTNNYTDAWFIGFSPSVTCGTWIGFDNRESLGEKETGAKAALPMWMDFMKVAVADRPDEEFSKANAPKKTIDVPAASATEPSTEMPATPDEPETPEDAPGGAEKPAPAPVPPVPDLKRTPPPTDMPIDSVSGLPSEPKPQKASQKKPAAPPPQ